MDVEFSTVVTDEKQRRVTIKKYISVAPSIDTTMAVRKASELKSEPYNSK